MALSRLPTSLMRSGDTLALLDLLTDSELHFRERLAARREAALNASE